MNIEPYLFFAGRCEEALDFYTKVLGAKVDMKMRFNESPEPLDPVMVMPGWESKIMHASFQIGDTRVMASDGHSKQDPKFSGFGLSINLKDTVQADKYFAALSDGGEVRMPMAKTFFSPRFGMVVDRFGVLWMIHVYL
jgi:PhnB protein